MSLSLFEKLLLDFRVGVKVVLINVSFDLVINFLGLKEFIHQPVVPLIATHLKQIAFQLVTFRMIQHIISKILELMLNATA